MASLLALLALFTLVIKSFLEWKTERDQARAQQSEIAAIAAESDTIMLAKSLQQ